MDAKTPVGELTDALLDYWVAKAECVQPKIAPRFAGIEDFTGDMHAKPPNGCWVGGKLFQPSKDWAHGGPIIEREEITTHKQWSDRGAWIRSSVYESEPDATADTPLVAAMRAYVASKFGDTVPEGSAE